MRALEGAKLGRHPASYYYLVRKKWGCYVPFIFTQVFLIRTGRYVENLNQYRYIFKHDMT